MNQHKTIIIAEAGVNHNGKFDNIKKLINIASNAGADYVKFQSFSTDSLVTKNAKRAKYQISNNKKNSTQFELLKKLELNKNDHIKIISYCRLKKIKPLFTPFDFDSLNLLISLNVKEIKIGSSDLNNLPFLKKISELNKKVFLSTGMSNMNEIYDAIKIFKKNKLLKKKLFVLHCNTDYPTNYKDANVSAMKTIEKEFNVNIGYSDHTLGIEVPISAVAMGAKVIEKHFTIDKKMKGPDHKASLNPLELKEMIRCIRNVELSKGSGIKKVSASERKNIKIVRKSIIAKKNIFKGDKFTNENLIIKRPGNGISPKNWSKIIGKKSKKNYKIDDLIIQ